MKEQLKQEGKKIVELDVRVDLKNKLDPFKKIMEAVKSVGPNDLFILHATFKPVPLFKVMKSKGFQHQAEQMDEKHWKITFSKSGE
ncbi:DUF2249 domain-containing protein [Chengkuizengella axinellae]|uniref:DUF2249 domain-containing protein n=1 Tax=Chengkuizengella axinellae TaxID=3064388 RepID=A0ABT9IUN7_9BACL|nr:DUF2249 domain-containing protein [Chengkuizengella sp. 2205SS18-9]MDP5273022.1 DUF2249 domain-containing protein [Chengkuizengella sp. 2205SS18-9]